MQKKVYWVFLVAARCLIAGQLSLASLCVGVWRAHEPREIEEKQHGKALSSPVLEGLRLLATVLFIVEIPSSDFMWRSGQELSRITQTDNEKVPIACYNHFDRQA